MQTRRHFIQTTLGASAGLIAVPSIFSGSLFAQGSPNKLIQVAQLGCGRMGLGDMESILSEPLARVVAVCDLDPRRVAEGKRRVEEKYKKDGESSVSVKVCSDYRELLADPAIDAVVISLPDHWHGFAASAAAIAGKHIYCQKPLTYNIQESIALRTAVRAKKVILQTGSQQRSETPFTAFRAAIESVWAGRVGKLKSIQIGVGLDKASGKKPQTMPIPAGFDFETWLGSAPQQEYMEGRVHPQNDFGGRPGWITTEDFGLGMITNWGAHHLDIAHLVMGQQLGGPSTVSAKAGFMQNDQWTVHDTYHIEMLYPDGVHVVLDDKFENGLKIEGDEGWIFCTRGAVKVTASDGNGSKDDGKSALRASDPKLISALGADARRLPPSSNQYRNWLESIVANTDPIAPVEEAARSVQACCAGWISMKLGREVTWDVKTESFGSDAEANALRSRKPRKAEFDIAALLKSGGV